MDNEIYDQAADLDNYGDDTSADLLRKCGRRIEELQFALERLWEVCRELDDTHGAELSLGSALDYAEKVLGK